MKVDGNESIVTAFLSAWGHGFAEEERSDFYLVTSNDAIGCKQRRCKKWEIKYRVEYDAATTSERYVKVKYGNKARISAYSNEIICDLAKFNLTSDLDWTLNEKLLRLSKRRTFFNFCPQFGNIVECCHVDVGDAEGYDPPTVEGEFVHPTPHPRARFHRGQGCWLYSAGTIRGTVRPPISPTHLLSIHCPFGGLPSVS